jgi:hypothetical protein
MRKTTIDFDYTFDRVFEFAFCEEGGMEEFETARAGHCDELWNLGFGFFVPLKSIRRFRAPNSEMMAMYNSLRMLVQVSVGNSVHLPRSWSMKVCRRRCFENENLREHGGNDRRTGTVRNRRDLVSWSFGSAWRHAPTPKVYCFSFQN